VCACVCVVQDIKVKLECSGGQRGDVLLRCRKEVTAGETEADRQESGTGANSVTELMSLS
jgi:hypothetical protein